MHQERIAADGSCWVGEPNTGTAIRLTADGERQSFGMSSESSGQATPIGPDIEGGLLGVEVDDEGTVWSANVSESMLSGFVTFDGEEWSHIPFAPVGDSFGPIEGRGAMFAGSDGGVWGHYITRDTDTGNPRATLVGWDGGRWTTYVLDPDPRYRFRHQLPDGGVMIGYDHVLRGTELRLQEVLPPDLDFRYLVNAPDGSMWGLASADEEDATSLYIITPEAVATAE